MKRTVLVPTIVINTGVAILHHQEVKLALIWESFKMRITDLYESKLNEDMGALPSMAELIVMAVVAQTSFAALKMMVKTAYKTGKGLNKIRKLAKAAGVALDAKINPDMYYDDEDEVMEAYIKTSKDASDALGVLRGKGKKIERGQDDDQGNLANQYASDTWDVYSWIEARTNRFQNIDPKFKSAIDDMMTLRSEAKKLETKPGSGKNSRFGNQIVTTLYPVMQYIDAHNFNQDDVMEDANSKMLDAAMKAIEHMIKQDGNKQSVSGYAYEVSRVFGGKPDARTLAAHYEKEKLNAS
jgi:hypothetical protein